MKSPSMRDQDELSETQEIDHLGGMSEGQREHKCEVFLHKKVDVNSWDCLVYPGKKLKPGTKIVFPE